MRHPHGTVRGVDVLASRAAGLIVVYAQLIRAGSTPSREREEGKTDRYSLTSNVRHRHHVSSASETRAPASHSRGMVYHIHGMLFVRHLGKGCVAPAAAVEGALAHQTMHPRLASKPPVGMGGGAGGACG